MGGGRGGAPHGASLLFSKHTHTHPLSVSLSPHSLPFYSSDGWDRTAQLSSIAMFLLNPYYRTVRGFAEMIEKEWLSFGHQFARRHGHADGKMNDDGDSQRSPVFLQFLDCIWQLVQVYPQAAEFNSVFLATIMDEVFNCRFGTFLGDCEKERQELRMRDKTVSLWTYLYAPSMLHLYRNPFYVAKQQASLLGDIFPHQLSVWDYHLRSQLKMRDLSLGLEQDYSSVEKAGQALATKIEVMEVQLSRSSIRK